MADAGLNATWLTGNGGIGFADNSPETSQCQTILGDMRNAYTTVALPTGVEGQTLTIKDVSGLYEAFEIRITGSVDGLKRKTTGALDRSVVASSKAFSRFTSA